jgi:hypothetical protein
MSIATSVRFASRGQREVPEQRPVRRAISARFLAGDDQEPARTPDGRDRRCGQRVMPPHGAGRFVERTDLIFRRDENEMIARGRRGGDRNVLVPQLAAVISRADDDRGIAATLNQERSAHDQRHGSRRSDRFLPGK